MPQQQPTESVTELLAKACAGDQSALAGIFPLIYAELHRPARHQLKREPDGPLLLAGYAAFSEQHIQGFDFVLRIAIESLAEVRESQGRAEDAANYRALLTSTGVR